MAPFGLPKRPLGTLIYGLGKQGAHKGGSKGKKLHFASYIVQILGGAASQRITENQK